jgi:hypothetical protein
MKTNKTQHRDTGNTGHRTKTNKTQHRDTGNTGHTRHRTKNTQNTTHTETLVTQNRLVNKR